MTFFCIDDVVRIDDSVCGHPSRRTRKRVLLRMRAAAKWLVSTISDLVLRSARAQLACVSKDGRISDSTIKQPDADMRHRPVQTGCRVTLSSLTSLPSRLPERGEQCTERTAWYQFPRLQGADPHPVWIWSADRLSAHRGRDVSKRLFGDLHRTHPLGLADATCSVLCATDLPVGVHPCNSRIFSSRPRWQASGCSFAPTRDHQRQETDFLRPRIPAPLQACHQETLPARTGRRRCFAFRYVNTDLQSAKCHLKSNAGWIMGRCHRRIG